MNRSESKYFNTAVKMDQALISLLEIKEFPYITVSEICKVAGVNRSTFYLHYETIGDLLEETVQHLLDDFRACFPVDTDHLTFAMQSNSLKDLNFINDRYLSPYLCYIRDNRRVFSTALANVGPLGFDRVFCRMYERLLDPILDRFGYPEQHRLYVMHYYLNGITAVVNLWLKNNCRESTEEIMEIIQECVFGREALFFYHQLESEIKKGE